METSRYDVVILGGGPAGAATALMLHQHSPALTVALLERSHYESLRIGETLPPTVRPLLKQLGVWDAFIDDWHLPAYGSCAAWGSDQLEENQFIYDPLGRGWHLDRARFDAMLTYAAAAAGVSVHYDTKFIEASSSEESRWRINAHTNAGEELTLDARFVVDATGRRASFARQQGVQRIAVDQLTGVAVFLAVDPGRPLTDTYTLVEAVPDGWWYSSLLPEGKIAVIYMTDADLLRAGRLNLPAPWFEQLETTLYTRTRLIGAEPLGPPAVQAAYSHRLERMAGDGWLAVGDAAMTYDPLSSLGIFKGLRSGIMAAYAVADHLKGKPALEKYEGVLLREFASYLLTRRDFYRQEQRWPTSPFWKRRHEEDSQEVTEGTEVRRMESRSSFQPTP